ncbi:hypothetical protein [Streptomyces variegatus]|uniref:hypothetical protein n=1 Tax=Streptomyces variegatus TaxID=284040 RepID=UPI003C2F8563
MADRTGQPIDLTGVAVSAGVHHGRASPNHRARRVGQILRDREVPGTGHTTVPGVTLTLGGTAGRPWAARRTIKQTSPMPRGEALLNQVLVIWRSEG